MGDLIDNNKNASSLIPVMQEEVNIGKKIIEKGRVKISKVVKEESEVLNLPTISEQVHIRRIPVNKIIENTPESVRYEGNTMIISVLQEVTVVEKKLLLVEEIHLTKTSVSSEETKEITLRREEINIERSDNKDVQNFKQ
jgi:uncharacterized protein (TIGR02271 family)